MMETDGKYVVLLAVDCAYCRKKKDLKCKQNTPGCVYMHETRLSHEHDGSKDYNESAFAA